MEVHSFEKKKNRQTLAKKNKEGVKISWSP